jgi:CDP-diglyceride synthetase
MKVSYTSHIRKGLVNAAIIIAINLIGHFNNLILLPWYGFIILTIFIIASFISTWIFNTQTKGYEPFSATLSHCFKTVAVATVIFFVYNFLAMNYFFPGYVTNQIEALKQEALQHGEKM